MVELSDYFDHRNGADLDSLIANLASSGVRAHSVHSLFGTGHDISSPDDEIHERGVDALIDAIELASVLGSEVVIVHASDKLTDNRRRRVERARGVLREVGVIARASGVVIALENLPPGYLGHTPEEIWSLLDGTDPDSVSVCFDSGHANLSGKFSEFAAALLPRSVTTHLHDNNGRADEHRFPGEGTIDWRRFGADYRALRCSASIMLECSPPEGMLWSEAFQRLRVAMGE